MGNTLARAAQWTSSGAERRGKLEYTPMNQKILETILSHITGYTGRNPEGGKLEFKSPLSWTTSLKPSDFTGGYGPADGHALVSDAKTKSGEPMLILDRADDDEHVVHVRSIETIESVLAIAGDRKMVETRACLEGK